MGKCKVVTELLDPQSEQVLLENSNVRKLGSFVYSNKLETGVFAMAVEDKQVFTFLKQILSAGDQAGHIVAVKVGDVVNDNENLCFWDIHNRVKQSHGAGAF